jgi:hypothetical protein
MSKVGDDGGGGRWAVFFVLAIFVEAFTILG